MEGLNMSQREKLRTEVKTERARVEEARKMAADPAALMAKIAQLRAQASTRGTTEAPAQTRDGRPFEITPKMRADAAAIAARDRGLPPDSR